MDIVLGEGVGHHYFAPRSAWGWPGEALSGGAEKLVAASCSAKMREYFELTMGLLSGESVSTGEAARLHESFALPGVGNRVPWGHVVGSLMVAAIDSVYGREGVVETMLKPQLFFRRYDEARKRLGHPGLPPVPGALSRGVECRLILRPGDANHRNFDRRGN
jgi:hypothetical protein